ncbi:MAG TPA: Holliday junction branch migration protein RuvA [Bacteroidales bacterium]|nr:Holliday junction branch migration protein RuvA [Bacteroidales bacterium]HQA93645.1 Holliday junction branch migration protein RuvA [Bacteroidales bacterium]
MYDYIRGTLIELNPADVTLEVGGIGYHILISLTTYSSLQKGSREGVKLYLHQHLREDEELLFGFFDKEERIMFRHLISVSGIGPGTARMMLSSMTPDEVFNAIVTQDVNRIKSVKGIGMKTAQRVILELQDKIGKGASAAGFPFDSGVAPSAIRQEAATALVLLGFTKPNVEKVLDKLLKEDPSVALEELIKKALKLL